MYKPSNVARANIPVPKTLGEQLHSMYQQISQRDEGQAVKWVDNLRSGAKQALRRYWITNGYTTLFDMFFNK